MRTRCDDGSKALVEKSLHLFSEAQKDISNFKLSNLFLSRLEFIAFAKKMQPVNKLCNRNSVKDMSFSLILCLFGSLAGFHQNDRAFILDYILF